MPGVKPFSEYTLTVNVYNKKGNGPSSDPVTFNTTEGGEANRAQYYTPAQTNVLNVSDIGHIVP